MEELRRLLEETTAQQAVLALNTRCLLLVDCKHWKLDGDSYLSCIILGDVESNQPIREMFIPDPDDCIAMMTNADNA